MKHHISFLVTLFWASTLFAAPYPGIEWGDSFSSVLNVLEMNNEDVSTSNSNLTTYENFGDYVFLREWRFDDDALVEIFVKPFTRDYSGNFRHVSYLLNLLEEKYGEATVTKFRDDSLKSYYLEWIFEEEGIYFRANFDRERNQPAENGSLYLFFYMITESDLSPQDSEVPELERL